MYVMENSQGIECALWPQLYSKESWCDTIIKGNASRLNLLIAFYTKVLLVSVTMQWTTNYFNFITNFALARMHCSPARALNAKTFSPGYWKMQHRLLQDAVDQYSSPSLFLTYLPIRMNISHASMDKQHPKFNWKKANQVSSIRTMHIAHTLEQMIYGYLCGLNTNKWNGISMSSIMKALSTTRMSTLIFTTSSFKNEEHFMYIYLSG